MVSAFIRDLGQLRTAPSGRGSGRLVPKKGYIGPVSTKTHSGDPDGTGGFGGFLGSGRFLALKFGFYEKFPRQNHRQDHQNHHQDQFWR